MARTDAADYLGLALERAANLGEQAQPLADAAPLAVMRAAGRARLAATRLPDRRTEAWKYSRVGALLEEGLLDAAAAVTTAPVRAPLTTADACVVTLVDGVPGTIVNVPEGVEVLRFSELDDAAAVSGRLAQDDRPFVALNAALLEDGVLIRISPDVDVQAPIEVVLAQNEAGRPCGGHVRLVVEVGSGARCTLVERQEGEGLVFTNSVIEARVAANAELVHYRLGLSAGDGRWLTALDVELARDSRYRLQQALLGAAFRRSEIRIHMLEPGAEVRVGGATLSRDRTHLDTQMCLEHAAPHCVSDQVFRAIAGERSRTVLNGRIHIHRDAQRTAAELSTKNLLLSTDAEIDAKPELEIYADDVTCAHGATVGQLDDAALFYLRARGVDEVLARTMLSFAFLATVVESFEQAELRDHVRAELEARFGAPPA